MKWLEAGQAAAPGDHAITEEGYSKGQRLCHLCGNQHHWRAMHAEKVYKLEEQNPTEWKQVVERWGTNKERNDAGWKAGFLLPHDLL